MTKAVVRAILPEKFSPEGVILLITPELLARINELARKKRTVGLTEAELAEQKKLYAIYLAAIRGQVTDLLESIEFVDGGAKK